MRGEASSHSLTVTHSQSVSHSHSLPMTVRRVHRRRQCPTHSLTHSLPHSLTHSLTLSAAAAASERIHTHSHSATHPPTHSLIPSEAILSCSFVRSFVTYSLSLSVTHSHSQSLTLTHSHSHSAALSTVVGCGLWAVGCGLWAVGCGRWWLPQFIHFTQCVTSLLSRSPTARTLTLTHSLTPPHLRTHSRSRNTDFGSTRYYKQCTAVPLSHNRNVHRVGVWECGWECECVAGSGSGSGSGSRQGAWCAVYRSIPTAVCACAASWHWQLSFRALRFVLFGCSRSRVAPCVQKRKTQPLRRCGGATVYDSFADQWHMGNGEWE